MSVSRKLALLVAIVGGLIPTVVVAHPGHDDEEHSPVTSRNVLRNVAFAAEHVRITERGQYRYIESDGIPNHATGRFPNRGNPNTISAQRHSFRVPLKPQVADKITPRTMGKFGIAINGVPFDPGANEFWQGDRRSGWQYEAMSGKIDLGLDQNQAHVQPTGSYHYHGLPTGLVAVLGSDKNRMLLIGYAADGFPIYTPSGYSQPDDERSPLKRLKSSYRVKTGRRPSGPGGAYDGTFVQDYEFVKGAGDLDECNGRTGVTPEYPQGTYYYVITDEYPFIPRDMRGTPDESFAPPGGGGGPPPGAGGRGFPPGKGPPGKGPPGKGPPGKGPPPFNRPTGLPPLPGSKLADDF